MTMTVPKLPLWASSGRCGGLARVVVCCMWGILPTIPDTKNRITLDCFAMTDQNPSSEPTRLAADKLEGITAELSDDAMRDKAIELAFDYRGDVTLRLKDGGDIVGYIYDRRREPAPGELRLMLTDGGEKQTYRYDQIAAIIFSGRDCAAGKSWETWVRKYAEKKAKGETAEIKPESLD